MKLLLVSYITIIIVITALLGCAPSAEEIRAEEDRIVVDCAEPILWDYSYTYIPEWGFRSREDSHRAFQIYLASADNIFLFEDEHPFKDYDNYIGFKADFYREFFDWGRLPPEDIMQKCGVSPPES